MVTSIRILPLLFTALVATHCLAQSSTRGLPSGYPTAQPVNQLPQGDVVPQSQLPGSSNRPGSVLRTPVQGSSTRSGTIVEGTVVEGSSSRVVPAPVVKRMTFEQKLWSYLIRGKYRNWAPVPGKSDAMYEGERPHGAFLKMYLNRKAAGSPKELPNGSIVIKENYNPQKALAAVTVMYKTAGYNPKAGDWYWVKFNPDGTVANKPTPAGSVRLAGRVGGCIDCHSGADGNDFAFFND